jgi:hypothetical protein
VILIFLAGMLCGAALLIALILITDRSFLDLVLGNVVGDAADRGERVQSLEVKPERSLAVGK